MLYDESCYRSYLRSVLTQRSSRNPAYSLRSMARGLGLPPSHLSQVLSGAKNLSRQKAAQVADRMKMAPDEKNYFTLLVDFGSCKTAEQRAALGTKIEEFREARKTRQLKLDSFRLISDWYHLPLLEMTGLDDFDSSPAWIAARLGIAEREATRAVERLLRMGLLSRDSSGGLKKTDRKILASSERRNEALRSYHRQMLERARDALDTQEPTERFVKTETFSIDVSQLEEARQLLRDCSARLVALFDRAEHRTETYHLGIQLFRLTQKGRPDA